jgi:hypothetical protein
MADDDLMTQDDDSSSNTSQQDGLGALVAAASTTTPEAKDYARRVLNAPDPGDAAEKSIRAEIAQKTAASKQALQEARARLLARQVPPSLAMLQMAAGFGAPTQHGNFSESLANVANKLVPVVQEREQLQNTKDQQQLALEQQLAGIDTGDIQAQLSFLKQKQDEATKMKVEALKVLGREIASGRQQNQQLSPFGKQARDEGNPVDSPQWNKRVKELQTISINQRNAQTGLDTSPLSPEERQAQANQYGVPLPKIDPYAGMSTKRKIQAQETDQRMGEQSLKSISDEIEGARQGIIKANRFMDLNQDNPTGKMQGLLPALSSGQQEMESIGSELSRRMRVKGEGSTSDFDAKQFAKATFGRDKTPQANKNIATAFRAKEQNTIDHGSFMSTYFSVNGHLRGAQDAWNQYLQDNPIFDSSKSKPTGRDEDYVLNPNRVDYKTYFRNQGTQPQQKARGGIVQHFDDGGLVRSAVQGATMGAGDELEAAASPGDFSENLKNARASVLREQEQNPLMAAGATAGGTALLLKGIQTARRMGMSEAALKLAPKHELLRLALMGGAFGAGQGLMSGEEGDRIPSGITGLVLGSTAGPLTGLAAKYGLTGIGNLVARSSLSSDPTTPADRRILEAMQRDPGVDPAARLAQAQKLKVPSTFGTSGGPNMQALGRASILEGGDVSDQMATEAAGRMAASRGQVEDRINQSLKPDEFFGQQDKLTNALYTNAQPLYEKAYKENPSIQSTKLRDILQTDAGEKAVKEALQFYRNQPGKPLGPVDALGMVQNPSLEFYDKVKQGFDQLIAKEEGQGPTPLGKTMRNLRGQLVTELDNQAPSYAAARAQYKGDLEVRDALRSGREDFTKMTPEEVRRAINGTPPVGNRPGQEGMSFAERDAFRSGVAQKMYEMINAPTGDFDAAKKVIGSPNMAQKIESIFDKPGEAKVFTSALQREMEEFQKSKELAATAGPARLSRAVDDPSVLSKLSEALGGSALEGMSYRSNMLGNVWNLLRLHPDMSEQTADHVSTILKNADPAAASDYVARLGVKAAALARRKGRAGKVGMTVAAITGALTAPPPHESNVEETP